MPAQPPSRLALVAVTALLLTSGLAGCIGDDDGGELPWSSFEEARDADGPVFEPNGTSTVRIKWLTPQTPDEVPKGQSSIFLLVFDSETDEPVTDAEVSLSSRMPAMGHGTAAETDPTHVAHGVYEGVINPTMGGQWVLDLTVALASGEQLTFEIGYNVQGGMDGGHGGHGGMGNMSMENPYGSYQGAQDAPGRVYEPTDASGPTRLKLLEPQDAANVSKDNGNVTVLLFDQDADEPVTDANVTLDAMMPAMGHGTSPETDPMHTSDGVYKGSTTYSMEGKWRLDISAELADGTTLEWAIEVDIGDVSETWGSDKPLFEPYNRTFEGDVQSADYNESHSFEVKGANATLEVNFTLTENTMALDDLTLAILDPEGDELGSATVTSDEPNASFTVDQAPVEGDYTARVTGQGLQAHYVIDIRVLPPSPA